LAGATIAGTGGSISPAVSSSSPIPMASMSALSCETAVTGAVAGAFAFDVPA
jgi:hypothetical protein